MEKMIDGHKIPETQKGLKYSWMRAETDDFSYYETFNSIEKVLGKYIKLIPHKNIDSAILEILTTGVLEEGGTTS